MREHGFLPSSKPAKRGPTSSRCFDKRQYLPRPERGGGQVLFCRGPWPGLEGAALRRRSVSFGECWKQVVKEQLEQYVKQVKEWHEHCRNNEQATKASLIAPLFVLLGYNMHDPRECKPEYRTDFGKGEKAATPVDWAFLINGTFAFFVEAKEVGAKLTRYAEQLGMYFAKEPAVKLGILTNGTRWQFYTDLVNGNVMDKEPFFTWDVLQR